MSGQIKEITAGREDIRLDAVGLHLPENMPLEDWQRVGERLRDTQQSLMWWIGDWLRFGERNHGISYADASEITGYKEGSLRTAVWLSGQFDVSMRIDKLTWHHHRHAASLPPAERAQALRRATDEDLSTRAFKALVSDMKRDSAPSPHQATDEQDPRHFQNSLSRADDDDPEPEHEHEHEPESKPEPAPDHFGYAKLTEEALLDLANGLRADLEDEKVKRKAAQSEVRKLKEKLADLTADDKSEVIRRLQVDVKNARNAKWRAEEGRTAFLRQVHALKKRVAELEREEVPLN